MYGKIKHCVALCLLLTIMLSCASCGLISVTEIDGAELPVIRVDRETEAAQVQHGVYYPESESETRLRNARESLASLSAHDFDGALVFVGYAEDSPVFPEDNTTVINRMTASRDALVEDALCVKLIGRKTSADEMRENAKREKAAGEVNDDILVIPSGKILLFAFDKSLADLSLMPEFSYEYDFIDRASMSASSLSSAVYAIVGDASVLPDRYSAVFMNKSLLRDAGINTDEIYASVRDGEWTWDKMIGYAETVDEVYIATPFSNAQIFDVIYKSSGGEYLRKDGTVLSAGFDAQALKPIAGFFSGLIDSGIQASSFTAASDFSASETSFMIHKLLAADKFADSSVDFGILPVPMTERGGQYRSITPNETVMFAIPADAENRDMSLSVILALNAVSTPMIRDGYISDRFDKLLCDADSYDMMKIILSGESCDPAYTLGALCPEASAATVDFAYKYRDADEKTFEKQLKKSFDAMTKALDKKKKEIDASNKKSKKK